MKPFVQKLCIHSAATVLALSLSQSALAATFSFTGLGSVPASSYSTTSDGITVTVTTPTAGHSLKYFSTSGIDGIGASSGLLDPAAVQQGESLTVSFSEEVTVGSITFNQWDGDRATLSSTGGNLVLDGDSCPLLTFSCTSETYDLSSLGGITSFTVTGDNFISAFLLAGLGDVQAVPVPAAGWLFLSALLGLAGKKRLRAR